MDLKKVDFGCLMIVRVRVVIRVDRKINSQTRLSNTLENGAKYE